MNENAKSEKSAAEAKLARRARLLKEGLEIASVAAKGGRVALATSLRGAMPLLEFYSGVKASSFQDGGDVDQGPVILDLSHGQSEVVKVASTKLFGEMLEIASITHPVYSGAPVYAMAVDGQRQAPRLAHLLALAAAAQDIWDRQQEKPECPEEEEPFPVILPRSTVAFISLAPGEYRLATGPQTRTEIRRAAMRERTNTPPPQAIMASNNQPVTASTAAMTHGHRTAVLPFTGAARGFARAGAAASPAPVRAAQSCGCGSGCSSGCSCSGGCSCGRCGRGVPFDGARFLDDGSCAPTGQVSCETQWRIRDCVKYAFCDMLRCLGDEICDDDCKMREEVDLGDCVEVFLCSFINCLPDAICPPEKPKPGCHDVHASGCDDCNFAVGE